jgi:hypothetical protein
LEVEELEQRLLQLEIQIGEQTGLILFSVQSLRLAVAAAVLEMQDSKAALPEELVVEDLKTTEEAQETHQQHLHLKVVTVVLVEKEQVTTAAAAAAAEHRVLLEEVELGQIMPVLVEMELHQPSLRAEQLPLMPVAAVAVAHLEVQAAAGVGLVGLAAAAQVLMQALVLSEGLRQLALQTLAVAVAVAVVLLAEQLTQVEQTVVLAW